MNKNSIDILTIGDVCIDLYMKVEGEEISQDKDPEHPKICFYHGSKIPVQSLHSSIAGNAINVAIGTHKLGLTSGIYTEMGDDEHAERIQKELTQEGIITDYIDRNKNTMTGVHPVIVYGGERTIFSHHEVRNYRLKNWPIPKWIYYTSISPGFESFQNDLIKYLKMNVKVGVAFNPGTYHLKSGLEGIKNFLEVTDVLFVNKDEAIGFVGKHELEQLHLKLQEYGPKLTIITEGDKGASGHDRKELVTVKPYNIKKPLLDKTGAGDAFASGVISALHFNQPLKVALIWGAINSSNVIREIGAVHGLKTKEEIEKIVSKMKP